MLQSYCHTLGMASMPEASAGIGSSPCPHIRTWLSPQKFSSRPAAKEVVVYRSGRWPCSCSKRVEVGFHQPKWVRIPEEWAHQQQSGSYNLAPCGVGTSTWVWFWGMGWQHVAKHHATSTKHGLWLIVEEFFPSTGCTLQQLSMEDPNVLLEVHPSGGEDSSRNSRLVFVILQLKSWVVAG